MALKRTKKGFTLVELLISMAVFSIFLTAIMSYMVDLYRNSRRIELEEQLYQDMRALMRQITVMVESNAIDYEEYFRVASGKTDFGEDYGEYGMQFYNFGWDGPGALCNDGITPANSSCIIDKTTLDKNIGKKEGNAFCGIGTTDGLCALEHNEQDQLYLINGKGTRKTFLALEPVSRDIDGTIVEEKALSVFWMNGQDDDGDDISDTWENGIEFNIDSFSTEFDTAKSEQEMYNNFIPISPLRSNIVDLKFYISPLEDPYKAFAETDPASGTLIQPHVTIILTMEPSAYEVQDYLGEIPQKTLQTTIYSDIQQDVRSY